MIDPANLDPALFEIERATDFAAALIDSATGYSAASEILERYIRQNSAEAKAGKLQELTDSEDYKAVVDILGPGLTASVIKHGADANDSVGEAEYAVAAEAKDTSITALLELVFGYHTYMASNLGTVFGAANDAEIQPAAWTATWKKLRDTLRPVGGIVLADIAGVFDELIECKYTPNFDPTHPLRGMEVAKDVSARTFYEVMENHLARAIMRRGEDGWSA